MCNAVKIDMNRNRTAFVLSILIIVSLTSCFEIDKNSEMKWLTIRKEYEGNPLYLRKPNHQNIWTKKNYYSKLVCITHTFDSVKSNGLPTGDYNSSLIDFDGEIVELFKQDDNGIIFLIETYGGERNYWFYVKETCDSNLKFEKLKKHHQNKKLEISTRDDEQWNFIKDYPFKLY